MKVLIRNHRSDFWKKDQLIKRNLDGTFQTEIHGRVKFCIEYNSILENTTLPANMETPVTGELFLKHLLDYADSLAGRKLSNQEVFVLGRVIVGRSKMYVEKESKINRK